MGQSDGQHTFAGQQWTTRYVECYKNRTLKVAECPRGSYFSPRIEKCIQNINIGMLLVFYDVIFNVAQMVQFSLDRIEDIVGKGENAGYQHFLLFLQCFHKVFP